MVRWLWEAVSKNTSFLPTTENSTQVTAMRGSLTYSFVTSFFTLGGKISQLQLEISTQLPMTPFSLSLYHPLLSSWPLPLSPFVLLCSKHFSKLQNRKCSQLILAKGNHGEDFKEGLQACRVFFFFSVFLNKIVYREVQTMHFYMSQSRP